MQGFSNEFQMILDRLNNNDPILTELDLSHRRFPDKYLVALGKALATNQTLRFLNLHGGTNISDNDVMYRKH